MSRAWTSAERVTAAVSHREGDRVPLLLTTTMHGAREVELPLSEYFSQARNVIEGQIRLVRRYRSDFYYGVLYAAVEAEAFGQDILVRDDGPVTAGSPIVRDLEQIHGLEPPDIARSPSLQRVLEVIAGLAEHAAGEAPVVGLVLSPFSLPVMQLGFERYLRLTYERRDLFWRLMAINEEFCVRWAEAQIAAGASAIAYYDPVSSPTITAPAAFAETGLLIARRTIARIPAPTALHLASGRGLPIAEQLATTGAAMLSASAEEDLAETKAACAGRMTVVGNLNGIAMRRWSPEQVESTVKAAIAAAAQGGGFILSDNHGEIPWQVPDSVLEAVRDAVDRWGRYPLDWLDAPEA